MFHPDMQSTTEGFSVVGGLKFRWFRDVVVDVWEVDARAGANGVYHSPHPRLFVLLDAPGRDTIDIGTDETRPAGGAGAARLSYIPAGLRTWSHQPSQGRLRHLDLHFSAEALAGRFAGDLDSHRLSVPRVMFDDHRILALAHLLADECSTGGAHDLYGESLALAILTRLFEVPRQEARAGKLPPRLLRQAMDFMQANDTRNIRLQEIADLVGLSQSYFSSAFKASTGVAPHQWQTQARVERVKTMLRMRDASLTDVAIAAGFSDQAHMTRVFKRFVGVTPAAWVRSLGE